MINYRLCFISDRLSATFKENSQVLLMECNDPMSADDIYVLSDVCHTLRVRREGKNEERGRVRRKGVPKYTSFFILELTAKAGG